MERVQQERKIELKHTQLDDLQIPSSPYFPAYDYAYAQGHGQGSPPMVQVRFQSVISQLFQHRIIRCGGAVDDDMASIIVAQLLYLETSFAWLELMSHRSFMPKLLIVNPPKGWPHVQCLLVDLFKFMEPYPRSAELGETVCFFSSLKIGAISGRDHITEAEMIIAEEFWKIRKQHKQHPQSAFV